MRALFPGDHEAEACPGPEFGRHHPDGRRVQPGLALHQRQLQEEENEAVGKIVPQPRLQRPGTIEGKER